jgi:hypothetical protein
MKPISCVMLLLAIIPQALKAQKVYRVKYESQADKKVYFVDYESRADLKFFIVKYESRAGWKNPEKQHLLL